MDNELLIKGILIRQIKMLESSTSSSSTEKIGYKTAMKLLETMGIKIVNPSEFELLFKDIVNEYQNTPNTGILLNKYPLESKGWSNGELVKDSKGKLSIAQDKKVNVSVKSDDMTDEEPFFVQLDVTPAYDEDYIEELKKLTIEDTTDQQMLSLGGGGQQEVDTILLEIINELKEENTPINWESIEASLIVMYPDVLENNDVLTLKKMSAKHMLKITTKRKVEEEKLVPTSKKSKLEELRKSMPRLDKIQMEDFYKTNLPYYAVLSYYVADKYIPVNDPFLTDFFINFHYISEMFKSHFRKLNPRSRLMFVKSFFEDKNLNDIYNNLNSKEGLHSKDINVFIKKFKIEDSLDIKDELIYNTMYYILSMDLSDYVFGNKETLQNNLKN